MAENTMITISTTEEGHVVAIDTDDDSMLLAPNSNQTPQLRLLQDAGVETVSNMLHNKFGEWPHPRIANITSDSAAAADIVVDDFTMFIANMVASVTDKNGAPKGFNVRLNATPTSTTLDVTPGRPFGGVDAALVIGDQLHVTNINIAEAANMPGALMRATFLLQWRLGQQGRTFDISWISQATKRRYGVRELPRLRASNVREFARDTERNLIWGHQVNDISTTTAPLSATKGYYAHAFEWNPTVLNGALTLSGFADAVQATLSVDNEETDRVIYWPRHLLGAAAQWGLKLDVVRQDAARQLLKFNVDTFIVPGSGAACHFKHHAALDGHNVVLIIDPDSSKLIELEGKGGLRSLDKLQDNAATKDTMGLYRVYGLKVDRPWNNGVIVNVNQVVA